MEFCVVKGKPGWSNEEIRFNNWDRYRDSCPDFNDTTRVRCVRLEEPSILGSVTNCVGELIGESNYGGNSFGMALMTILSGWERERVITSTRLRLDVSLTMSSTNTANVKVFTPGFQIFDRLMNFAHRKALLPNSFEWNLNVKMFEIEFEADVKNLEPVWSEEEYCYGLEMAGMQITEDVWSKWDFTKGSKKEIEFEGEIRLTLRLDHTAVTKLYLESLGSVNVTLWPRNLIIIKGVEIVHNQPIIKVVESDLVILAGGEKDKEKGIRCHTKILAERYPGFTAMFQADLSGSRDNCLEIVDMTEAGVRAMLQFVYARDLEEASKKCEIAVELLEGGHKYGMEDLEDAMMHLIWVKPVEWVSVDLALKILLFSRNIGGKFEKIEKTSLAILKWYSKKPGSLIASEEYRKLHLENRQLAMELGESFLKI